VGCDWPVRESGLDGWMDGWMDIGHIIIPFLGFCVVNTHDYVDCHANYASALFALELRYICWLCLLDRIHMCVFPPRKFDSGAQHSTAHTHDPCYCLNIELDHQRLFLVFSPPPSSYISPNDECIVAEYCCAALADGQQLLFL
jgi:hypothetical protein